MSVSRMDACKRSVILYPERGELERRPRSRLDRTGGRLSTRRNNNSRRATEHTVFSPLRLPEERICTWQRTERQLPEKVSRVADHPSISTPRAVLIFVSFHSAILIALAPSLDEAQRRAGWVPERVWKNFPGTDFPGRQILPRLASTSENGHRPACNAVASFGSCSSTNPPSPPPAPAIF